MKKQFEKPVIVISRCIEHEPCRWNSVMISSEIVRKFKPYISFRTVCPESDIGLGIPRSPLRIIENEGAKHLYQAETDRYFTDKMNNYTAAFLKDIDDIDGFILKEKSPSCGTRNVRVYPQGDKVSPLTGKAAGFFGGAVLKEFPGFVIENEGRLRNQDIREHFLTSVFAHAELRKLLKQPSIGNLVKFHTENKLILMAYNQKIMRELGKIVSNREKQPSIETVQKYASLFETVFTKAPRYTSNINVLMHAMGYFSRHLGAGEKKHFLETLELYRLKKTSLSTPCAVLNSWIVRFEEKYLMDQTFFSPYPVELIDMSDSG